MAFGLHAAGDHGFDGGTASEVAFDDAQHTALLV
jgi:hypothetical protein